MLRKMKEHWLANSSNSKELVLGRHAMSLRQIAIGMLLVLVLPCATICAQEQASSPAPQGLFDIVFAGGPLGVAIMLVLFGLSLTAVYLIIEQMLTLRRKELMPEKMAEHVRALTAERKIKEAN